MARRYRSYSLEFKRQVAQQYLTGEIPLARLARQHDISRNLIWITEGRHIPADRFSNRVARQLQLPRDLPDRLPSVQMLPTYPCNRLHYQHLPSPRQSIQRDTLNRSTWGGSILDADPTDNGSLLHAD